MERLKELEQEVSGGATVAVALILNNKLYIANVGKLILVMSAMML